MATLDINTTSDDCYGTSDGGFSATSTTAEIGSTTAGGVTTRAWFPFVVSLWKSLVITSATLKVRSTGNSSGTTCKVKIGCEAADNPSAPTTKNDLYARTLSTSYLTNNNVSAWTAGTEYSFDITGAVQEILNRAGWVPGNTMAVLIHDNGSDADISRIIATEENVTYAQAILEIVYVAGGQVIVFESD